jgi:hypothetical protein
MPWEDYEENLASAKHVFLYLHGNSGSRASFHRIQMYKLLAGLDAHVLTIDYRGKHVFSKFCVNCWALHLIVLAKANPLRVDFFVPIILFVLLMWSWKFKVLQIKQWLNSITLYEFSFLLKLVTLITLFSLQVFVFVFQDFQILRVRLQKLGLWETPILLTNGSSRKPTENRFLFGVIPWEQGKSVIMFCLFVVVCIFQFEFEFLVSCFSSNKLSTT